MNRIDCTLELIPLINKFVISFEYSFKKKTLQTSTELLSDVQQFSAEQSVVESLSVIPS